MSIEVRHDVAATTTHPAAYTIGKGQGRQWLAEFIEKMKGRMGGQALQAAGIAASSRDRQAAIEAEQEGQVRGAILAGVPEELTKAAEQYSETGEVPQYQPGGYLGAASRMPTRMRRAASQMGLPATMEGPEEWQDASVATAYAWGDLSQQQRHQIDTIRQGMNTALERGMLAPTEAEDVLRQGAGKIQGILSQPRPPAGRRNVMDSIDFITNEETGEDIPTVFDGKSGTPKVLPGWKGSDIISNEQMDKWIDQAYLYGGHDKVTTDKDGKSTTVHVPATEEEVDTFIDKRVDRRKRAIERARERGQAGKAEAPPAPSPEKVAAGTMAPSYVVNWKKANEVTHGEQGPYGEVGKELALLENEAQNAASPEALATVKDKMLDMLDRLPEEAVTLGPGMTRTRYPAGEGDRGTMGGTVKDFAPLPAQPEEKLAGTAPPPPHGKPYTEPKATWHEAFVKLPRDREMLGWGAEPLSTEGEAEKRMAAGGVGRSVKDISADIEKGAKISLAEVAHFIRYHGPKNAASADEALAGMPAELRAKIQPYAAELAAGYRAAEARGDGATMQRYLAALRELNKWVTQR